MVLYGCIMAWPIRPSVNNLQNIFKVFYRNVLKDVFCVALYPNDGPAEYAEQR